MRRTGSLASNAEIVRRAIARGADTPEKVIDAVRDRLTPRKARAALNELQRQHHVQRVVTLKLLVPVATPASTGTTWTERRNAFLAPSLGCRLNSESDNG